MSYLLDTNILIALSKPVRNPALALWLQRCPASDLVLSSVVLAEIEYGIAKSARQAHNRQVFDEIIAGFQVANFDQAASRCYGPLRAELERRGQLIGPNDLMIAAHALALDLTLVTDNTDEFSRVAGLRVENWVRQTPARSP
ncbi:VapC toxin family PIN domain ribonuclease [Thiocystis minor]|uniref:type II toxin-antitoxin system VapC family toxin n=1 Tax=Thiocystis minor TaxID=61597 RepID=UPI001912E1B3|nr:type II toxin-antitoxin system VapC family toxin [Thiocystis minor]MBK5966032.1 VapC toxin family PIN domain ribonuclease [Thiocystis minor]